jgi:cysteinyl-tRNA synthetase
MIKFLIQRPIAVLMAFAACFIVGLVTYSTLPVSLLPDIAIPEITVQVSVANTSARELENTVVRPLRQQLVQVSKLRDMSSETRDGAGIIRLSFDYGTNTDLAFIEVNEKIDAGNLAKLKKLYQDYVFDILGLKAESESVSQDHEVLGKILDMVMSIRTEAKQKKDWATSDKIRDELKAAGVAIKDTKEGYEWELVEN